MNFNLVTANGLTTLPVQMAAPTHSSSVPATTPKQTVVSGTQSSVNSAFYTYQKEPWLTEPGYEHITNREEYVRAKKSMSELDLALLQITYNQFNNHLADVEPEIAKKSFGFTLGADANLKIISYDNSLTDAERSRLSEIINSFQSLKEAVQHHAKTIMLLADHDHETFGSRRDITLDNFQEIIDYGKVLSQGQNGMQDEWIRQVQTHAESGAETYISIDI